MKKTAAHKKFQAENLRHINAKLQMIIDTKEVGELVPSDHQGIFIFKNKLALELYCYEKSTNQLSDSMSRVNLEAPFELLSPYMQTAFSTAFWHEAPPEHLYLAGFGGGVLSLQFHHFFPDLMIDGSEIDPAILKVAENYFAVPFDKRVNVSVADGRSDFESKYKRYDIVIIDVFFGGGSHANHLATTEFFATCKANMSERGVLCANIIERDPLHKEKIAAIHDNFDHVYGWNINGARVTFASMQAVDLVEIQNRIEAFLSSENLKFPMAERVRQLERIYPNSTVEPLRDTDVEHLKMQKTG